MSTQRVKQGRGVDGVDGVDGVNCLHAVLDVYTACKTRLEG